MENPEWMNENIENQKIKDKQDRDSQSLSDLFQRLVEFNNNLDEGIRLYEGYNNHMQSKYLLCHRTNECVIFDGQSMYLFHTNWRNIKFATSIKMNDSVKRILIDDDKMYISYNGVREIINESIYDNIEELIIKSVLLEKHISEIIHSENKCKLMEESKEKSFFDKIINKIDFCATNNVMFIIMLIYSGFVIFFRPENISLYFPTSIYILILITSIISDQYGKKNKSENEVTKD